MGYEWEDLLFIEHWRLRAARGMLIAARWEDGQMLVTLRLHHEAWHPTRPLTFVDVEAVDTGNILREKPHRMLDHFSVLLRTAPLEVGRAARPERSHTLLPASEAPVGSGPEHPGARGVRRLVGPGSRLSGIVTEVGEDGTLLVDVGFPVLLRGATGFRVADAVSFRLNAPFDGLLL
jgi:hypothetical protein